jgi:hypothetical protein
MFEKIYVRKWSRRDWFLLSIFAAIALGGIVVGHINDQRGDVTSSIAEFTKQDGTSAYPYAEASRCPLNTDLVFWLDDRSIPNMPHNISVCFVRKLADQR